jgi:hypothetical protein
LIKVGEDKKEGEAIKRESNNNQQDVASENDGTKTLKYYYNHSSIDQ